MQKLDKEMQEEIVVNNVGIIDDIVSKNYLGQLEYLKVKSLPDNARLSGTLSDSLRMFQINQLVFDHDEFMLDKFATLYSAVAGSGNRSVFVLIDKVSEVESPKIYLGIRIQTGNQIGFQYLDVLAKTLQGQFPGTKISHQLFEEELETRVNNINVKNFNSVASVSVVPSLRDEINENQKFVQGIDKLINGVHDEAYTALLLANGASSDDIAEVKSAFERLYTDLAPLEQTELNRNWSVSEGMTAGYTLTEGSSYTKTAGVNRSHSDSKTTSNTASVNIGANIGVGGVGASGGGYAGVGYSRSWSKGHTDTVGTSSSASLGQNRSTSKNVSINQGLTAGEGQTLTFKNKWISNILTQIDEQLERVKQFEATGMWYVGAYFMSRDSDVAESIARTYRAIMQGSDTGVEVSAVNAWFASTKSNDFNNIIESLAAFQHPVFNYGDGVVTPAVMMSGDEVALALSLPQESVPGLPVIARAPFALEVNRVDGEDAVADIPLGNVFRMGDKTPTKLGLNQQSMAMHTFVTGATGSGKSTAVYKLLDGLAQKRTKFMVIEPAKGEYKHVFGSRSDVSVYGTNPLLGQVLRINPFKFAEGIHVLEHIDRLIDIFNVAWPMEAAMPAILKKAILASYESVGWDMLMSVNTQYPDVYPNFNDVMQQLVTVINSSAYSAESKGDYTGALVTRVESLANGLNKLIFTADDLSDAELFDENVILDLSRVGSSETKSLIMGLLVVRLNEYRMTQAQGMDVGLHHVTVLEEAHNLLKNTQHSKAGSLAEKSVEMITNAIAEMRTYGEGFIIADQSPSTVDLAAIRNTNTKLIMRLPDDTDRQLAGKSMALNDKQINELATLPKGVAVVYQNDWLAAVPVLIEPAHLNTELYKGQSEMIDMHKVREQLLEDLSMLRKNGKRKFLDENKVIERVIKLGLSSRAHVKIASILSTPRPVTFNDLRDVYAEVFPEVLNHLVGNDIEVLNNELVNYLNQVVPDIDRVHQGEVKRALMLQAAYLNQIDSMTFTMFEEKILK